MIRLYLKIPESFVFLILLDGFWIEYMSFGSWGKFNFFAQFPVDHLPYPVVYIIVLFSSTLLHHAISLNFTYTYNSVPSYLFSETERLITQ